MAKDHADDSPKLSEIQVQVLKILGTEDNETVMLILDKRPGGRRYVLRTLKREDEDDDPLIDCARAEAEASAKLNHPAILKTHDFRTVKSFFKVVKAEQLMEYVDGKPLDQLALHKRPIGVGILIFQKVASALAHMQRRGVLHGNLRPSNILLSRTGQVKVKGYGRSLVQPKFKETLPFNGNYAAPEQIKEKMTTPQTEVYNLGATFYHVLTGKVPAAGRGAGGEGEKIAMPSAANVKIPAALNTLIVSCLQSHAPKRPAEPYAVLQSLDAIVKEMALEDDILAGIAAGEEV